MGSPVPIHEQPLHVRVAEALGWRSIRQVSHGSEAGNFAYNGIPPEWQDCDLPVPSYDTDWSATGPLVERFRFDLAPIEFGTAKPFWRAMRGLPFGDPENWTRVAKGTGDTALLAVCDLILALHASGDLVPRG